MRCFAPRPGPARHAGGSAAARPSGPGPPVCFGPDPGGGCLHDAERSRSIAVIGRYIYY